MTQQQAQQSAQAARRIPWGLIGLAVLILALLALAAVCAIRFGPQLVAGLAPRPAPTPAPRVEYVTKVVTEVIRIEVPQVITVTVREPYTVTVEVPSASTAPTTTFESPVCKDGKILANQANFLTRVPIAVNEGISVWELSWTGFGFGGFDRAIVIVPQLTDLRYAIHVLDVRTVHGILYCGTMKAVEEWAPTHVDAMIVSSQAKDGSRPDPQEIGVYRLNLDGTLTVIRAAPKGPSVQTLQKRLEVSFHK